jgi:hypothetical protein
LTEFFANFYKQVNFYFLQTLTSVSAVKTSQVGTMQALCDVEILSDVWQLMCLREFIAFLKVLSVYAQRSDWPV